METMLRVPDEFRFVQALALAVDRADCLRFLCEVGALEEGDLGVVRRVREAVRECGRVGVKWEVARVVEVLGQALEQEDQRAFLAYEVKRLGWRRDAVAGALARMGMAQEWYGRPWGDGWGGMGLKVWRGWVERLLEVVALPAFLEASVGAQTVSPEQDRVD